MPWKVIIIARKVKEMCKCENCGGRCECGEVFCAWCFLDIGLTTDVDRRLYSGGRFYGESLLKKEDKLASADADGGS